jgi:hypothetical protein
MAILGLTKLTPPRKPREIADYVFCQHTKNNTTNYLNQRYRVFLCTVPVQPYPLHFFVLSLIIVSKLFCDVLNSIYSENAPKILTEIRKKHENGGVFI